MNTLEILQNLKFEQLNEMQNETLTAFNKHRNLVLISPTGSGKTLAILIPLSLQLMKKNQKGSTKALILTPSRELALQIEKVFKSMGTPLTITSCYGGRPTMDEHRVIKSLQPDVIVGTPGRINDHLGKGNIDTSQLEMLVIDEFDKSLELGFQEEMQSVVEKLPCLRRRILLSATDSDEIPQFVSLGEDCGKLEFKDTDSSEQSPRLLQHIVRSPETDKLDTLHHLLSSIGAEQSIIFVNYRESVDRIYKYLKDNKIPCVAFHGGMEQPDRERALYKFSNGTSPIMISTDLAARGLDIEGVKHIIHYHLPTNEEAFVHRNGRTARWKESGNSYLIINDKESIPEYVDMGITDEIDVCDIPLQNFTSIWTTLYIGKGKKDKINKMDIVGFLYKKGQLKKDDIGRVDVKDHYAFAAIKSNRVKKALQLIRNEKIKGVKTLFEVAK